MSTDELLTVDEAAKLLRLPVGTLRSWRSLDRGPRCFKHGRRVVYRRSAIEQWIKDQESSSARGDS